MRCNFYDAGIRCGENAVTGPLCPAHDRVRTAEEGTPESPQVTESVTSSNDFIFCAGRTAAGDPCGAYPHNGGEFCIFHDPAYREQRLQNSAAGGAAPRPDLPPFTLDEVMLDLGNPEGIHVVLDVLVRLELLARISPARTRNILRALSIAQRNLTRPRDSRPVLDPDVYRENRHVTQDVLQLAIEEAESRESPNPERKKPSVPRSASFDQLVRLLGRR